MSGDYTTRLVLFDAHQEQARAVVRVYLSRHPGLKRYGDEVENAGLLGLWLATARHDPAKGRFDTFAQRWVWGAIIDYFRQYSLTGDLRKKHRRAASGTASLEGIAAAIGCPLDVPARPDPTGFFARDSFDDTFRDVKPDHRDWLWLYYAGGYSQTEIAARYGVTRKRVEDIFGLTYRHYRTQGRTA